MPYFSNIAWSSFPHLTLIDAMGLDRVLVYLCRWINCGVYENTSFSGVMIMRN
jgi:hypothetical protein